MEKVSMQFGCEVPEAPLVAALLEEGVQQYYNGTPSGRIVLSTVREEIARKHLKKFIETTTDILASGTQKNLTAQCMQLQNYIRNTSELNETCMGIEVADALNGTVVATGLRLSEDNSEVDAAVRGTYKGKPVFVICEMKTSMDANVPKAFKQATATKGTVVTLRSLDPEGPVITKNQLKDYKALQIADNKDSEIMFAFGAIKFSEAAVKDLSRLSGSWFKVVPNPRNKFVASFVSGK